MTKEKVVNYTPEMTAEMKDLYAAGETTEAIAEKFGKTVRSVIAKLSREGVYHRKEYTTKNGEKPVKKDVHAEAIGAIAMLSDGEIDSLTKANKTALVKILTVLEELKANA